MELHIPQNEKSKIEGELKKKRQIQKNRSQYERNWLVNIAFLYGKQHFVAQSTKVGTGLNERILWELKSEERKQKTLRVSNYILPLYRSMLSRLVSQKMKVTVDPCTSRDSDKGAARVSEEALEEFHLNVNKGNPIAVRKNYAGMIQLLIKMFGYMLCTGRGYLIPYFNPNTMGKAFLDNQIVEGQIGEVEAYPQHQLNIFEDSLGRYLIEQQMSSVVEIYNNYGVEVPEEKLGLSDVEQQLLNMLEGQRDDSIEGSAMMYKSWYVPCKEYPNGRLMLFTEKKLIVDEALPQELRGKIPYFGFDFLDIMMLGFPQGMIEQLIPLQEEYNYTLSRIYAYKKFFAGKLKIPRGAKLSTKYDDDVGQIIIYAPGREPHFEKPPEAPKFLFEDLIRIRKDMEDTVHQHDAALGRLPQQVRSGVAIENLTELDNGALYPQLIGAEVKLEFFFQTVLDIMEARYSEPRLLSTVGEDSTADVRTFLGSNLSGQRRIKINLGSNLPSGKSERQQFIMLLAEKGYIDKPRALELMEFGDITEAYNPIDRQAQRAEIGEMLNGVAVDANEWDYHPVHIKTIEDYIKTEVFKKLQPPVQQLLLRHRKMHQQYLQLEMQAAQRVGTGSAAAQEGKPVNAEAPGTPA